MTSDPRTISFANCSRILVCLVVFTFVAVGYFGSANTVETAETVAPPARVERTLAPRAPIAPSAAVPFDFDGDGKTDIGRWHGASTEHKVYLSDSSSYQTTTIGSSASKPVSGEFDGDGRYDVGTYLNGAWTVKLSKDSSTITSSPGTTGDIPVMGNFDGTGPSDCSVFRPSDNTWRIDPDCSGSTPSPISYGTSGDIPVPGDFDGDGTTDRAVYRPSTGYWYANRSSAGSLAVQWGISTDVPMAADFDNDGKDDLVVFRPSSGTWYVLKSEYGFTTYSTQVWGNWYDQPVVGYYDLDGIADYAIWRPTTGEWWILKSTGGNLTYSLGVPGDTAIPSAFTKQVGGTATGYELATSRLDPENATGGSDLYSRNFSWGTSLVSLPGRSGLDAGLGLSYNSLVWIKTGGSMYFDPDSSNVAPGFKLGMPTIEPIYYNDTRSKWAYMMVTPSGKRVEFVETSVDEVFETADSSYTQLITGTTSAPNVPSEGITMTVKSTDGTQMTYSWNTGAYRCTRIKDRNGNYIDIAYSAYGKIETITDTLGRVINVNYDGYGRVSTITQTWKGTNGSGSNTTHTYATLTYTTKTVATNWSPAFYGPPNDTAVTVLDKVTYADGSATKFEYNGYIQVKKVSNIAADSSTHVLNYVENDLDRDLTTTAQSDVPRVGATRTQAENFNSGSAVVVTNSVPSSGTYTFDGVTASGTKIDVGVTGHPDSLFTRYWYHSSGWKKGLPIGTEDCVSSGCTGTDRKRWTWADWTQDNTGVSYILNPRVTESKVGDAANIKRTTINYGSNGYGLPETVEVFNGSASTAMKKSVTTYNLSSTYTNRRIIGRPSMTESWGYDDLTTDLEYVGKVTYAYDEGDFSGTGQNISPTKHDGDNYGSTFVTGRGNVTTVKRWDATAPTSVSTESTVKYNTAGSVVSKTTPWYSTYTRTVGISYTDNFNSTVSPATYAYPTTITDPNSQSSTVKYRYDIGANVEATSPAPAGQTYGKTSKRLYDSLGRLERDSVYVNTAEQFYTRYEYFDIGTKQRSYTTVVDTDPIANPGPTTADEVMSESLTDGAGRVLRSRTEHPGSTGGWTATKATYDILGRVYSQSVPTEVSISGDTWTPAGDDYTRGWLYTYQKYDWKGRVVRKINTDGADSSTLNDSDILISYEGCGCAGGQVTTIESESVPRDDTSGNARRKQKVYEDILGRSYLTEVYGWNGTTVYTSTEEKFNGRDQVLRTRQFEGTTSSSTYQDVTMTYDGFGRMKTRHYPIEDAMTETTWNYNLDDSIYQIIDPRGAITDFTYNSRGLTTQVAYTPVSGVPDTPTVTFDYDNLGNRTSVDVAGITDTTYSYDSLSRLTKERVRFDELGTTNFDVDHSYNLSGGLASITDPFGYTVNYAQDKTGRLSSVSGNALAQHPNGAFADNIQYRAFGATKQMDFKLPSSQTAIVKMSYNNRLQVSHFEATQPGSTTLFTSNADFTYMTDGSQAAKDDAINNAMDRTNKYDFAGRITYNQFGIDTATSKRVYEQSANYDAFSNLTDRATTYWDEQNAMDVEFTDGRITSDNTVVYDAAGNIVSKGTGATLRTDTFDASGRRSSSKDRWASSGGQGATVNERQTDHIVDGDRRPVIEKLGARQYSPTPGTLTMAVYKYQVWSSVLGQAVATMDPSGNQIENRIYAGSTLIATARGRHTTGTSADDAIDFHVKEPVTNTSVTYSYNATTSNWATAEQEPFGQNVSSIDPYIEEWNNYGQVLNGAQDPEWQCVLYEKMNGEFTSMPSHCAKAAWESEFVIFGTAKNKSLESLKKMMDSPLQRPSIPGVESQTTDRLATAAKATYKPSNFGPIGSEDPDIPNCGTQDCVVNVPDLSIPEFVDATSSGFVTSENMKNFNQAVQIVRDILTTSDGGGGENSCAKFFGGVGEDALNNIVASISEQSFVGMGSDTETGIRMKVPVEVDASVFKMPSSGYTTVSPIGDVNINTGGAFVSGFGKKIGGYGSATVESRVIQLLHEMGHLVITSASASFVEFRHGNEKQKRRFSMYKLNHLLKPDKDDESLSNSNTSLVKKECGGLINAAVKARKQN